MKSAHGLVSYIRSVGLRWTPAQTRLWAQIEKHRVGRMSSSPEQTALLGMLCSLVQAQRVLEVGVFMGFTTLQLAQAVGTKGTVVAIDHSLEFEEERNAAWKEQGVLDRIQMIHGKADRVLQQLAQAHTEPFDVCYIDADKRGNDTYFEHCLGMTRNNGLICVDNTLWHHEVLAPNEEKSPKARMIHEFNVARRDDPRVDTIMVPINDGLLLCRKLPV